MVQRGMAGYGGAQRCMEDAEGAQRGTDKGKRGPGEAWRALRGGYGQSAEGAQRVWRGVKGVQRDRVWVWRGTERGIHTFLH